MHCWEWCECGADFEVTLVPTGEYHPETGLPYLEAYPAYHCEEIED